MRSSARRAGTGFSPIPDALTIDIRFAGFAISVSTSCKSMKKVRVLIPELIFLVSSLKYIGIFN